jgi:3-hydroxy-9,10-secoandrosta-1,3,5(10)-triene-9,17-dione monooxygenase reductase component
VTMPGVDAAQFRQLMGRFATGVSVLTTRRPDGRLVGMTASSIASVSLTPPLLLVCVDHKNDMHDAMAAATHFAVNILAADQEALARRFAAIDPNRFDGVGYRASRLGIPLLDGALAHLECSKQNAVPGGDHTVFFGLVSNGAVTNARPLLYYRGGYAGL